MKTDNDFILPMPDKAQSQLAIGWLWLGVLSLLTSGIFSLLLVLSRIPFAQHFIPWIDFFHTALVVHVDLSVLVWFLAFAGVLWSLNATPRFMRTAWLALVTASLGTLIMALSPFTGDGHPLMSNYIPILQNSIFITGLLMFVVGVTLLLWRSMVAIPMVGQLISATGAIRFGLNATTVSVAMALMAFAWSYFTIPDLYTGKVYYELLFWGGGHVLQFSYTLLMLVGWLWLSSAGGIHVPVSPRVVLVLFSAGLFTVFIAPIIYFSYPTTSSEHINLFTWLMRYGGSFATLPLAVAVVYALLTSAAATAVQKPQRAALVSSIILFGFGGLIGFFIHGSDVTIPAHYHGSIVGVTLALMGVTYELLPRFGYAQPSLRLTTIQPYLYGGGQLLHVTGLLWSGGYGVKRKVAGAAQGLEGLSQHAAMGLMGLGGLISIIGGFIFIYVVIKTLRSPRNIADPSL